MIFNVAHWMEWVHNQTKLHLNPCSVYE